MSDPQSLTPGPALDRQEAKDLRWLRVCLAIAAQSKCRRAQYGSLILGPHGEPVALGYNGKPAGACNDGECYREGLPPNAPKAKCCLHSEQNAVAFADYTKAKGGTFYVSGLPCEDCALLIMQSGVARLVCMTDERGYPGLEVIARYGVPLQVRVYPRCEVDSLPLCRAVVGAVEKGEAE